MVVCHTSASFYEGLVCFLILKNPPSSFIPSFWISEVRGAISEQRNLILDCWVESVSDFNHNGLVVIILCKVYELLKLVNVVVMLRVEYLGLGCCTEGYLGKVSRGSE